MGDAYTARLESMSMAHRRAAREIPVDTKDRILMLHRHEHLSRAMAYDNAIEIYESYLRQEPEAEPVDPRQVELFR